MIEWARATWNAWKQDRLLGMVVRNTGYLFSSSTLGTALSMVQSIFAARLLGVFDFGVLDNITQFSSTVNRLFSFRMGELVVRYISLYQAEGRPDRAAAVVKIAALVEGLTSLLAFVILVLLAPWAALTFAKDARWTPLFIFYGVTILGNVMTETSTGVLQVARQYRSQAAVNLSQSILTALMILVAYLTGGGIVAVVAAYLLGKMILGIGPMVLAWRSLNTLLGQDWYKASLRLLPPWRELAHFAITTNLSATLTLLVRDSERLWVSFFLSPLEAGYYKVAMAFVTLLITPINPFIATTYPELSRSITEKRWAQLRRLLRRVTIIAGGWTGAVAVGLLVFGPWLIGLYGAEFLPAFPALVLLLVGYGVANTLFWNRSLLLAFNLPGYPFKVMLWCGVIKVLLGLWIIPTFGFTGEAALLSAYFVISVGLITLRGIRMIPAEASDA